MKHETKKEESISVRVTWETKQKYEQLKKEYHKSGAELITFFIEHSKNVGNDTTRLNELDRKYECIEDIHKIVKNLEKHLVLEKQAVINEKNNMVSHDLPLSLHDRMKKSVTDYVEKVKSHTSSFGIIRPTFDVEDAKHKVCEINQVSFDDFSKTLSYVEDGWKVDEAVEIVMSSSVKQ